MEDVYRYFLRLSKLGIWEKVLADLVKIKRLQEGCNAHPGLLIIDAQSVKTSGKGEQRGFDGGKKGQGTLSARSSWTTMNDGQPSPSAGSSGQYSRF